MNKDKYEYTRALETHLKNPPSITERVRGEMGDIAVSVRVFLEIPHRAIDENLPEDDEISVKYLST